MPQLEQIDTFTSQIFWLLVCFGVVYFFMSRFAAPKLENTIGERKTKISRDIDFAETYKNKTIDLSAELEKKTSTGKAEAINIITIAGNTASSLYEKEISAADENLKKNIEASEKEINLAKEKAVAELNKNVAQYVEEIVNKVTGGSANEQAVKKALMKLAG